MFFIRFAWGGRVLSNAGETTRGLPKANRSAPPGTSARRVNYGKHAGRRGRPIYGETKWQ